MYLHPKNRPVSIEKRRKMCCLHHCRVFTRCCFKFIPVSVPFSKSTVFEICRQKMCPFCVNGRPIRHIFHCFQDVPASCERSLRPVYTGKMVTIGFAFTRVRLGPYFLGTDPYLFAYATRANPFGFYRRRVNGRNGSKWIR